jgi:hypothetical protein
MSILYREMVFDMKGGMSLTTANAIEDLTWQLL